MTEQERIEKLQIEALINFNSQVVGGNAIEIVMDINKFKSSMLRLLLPWRDFEKNKPIEGKWYLCTSKTKNMTLKLFFDKGIFVNAHNQQFINIKYWIEDEDLLATLPKEES